MEIKTKYMKKTTNEKDKRKRQKKIKIKICQSKSTDKFLIQLVDRHTHASEQLQIFFFACSKYLVMHIRSALRTESYISLSSKIEKCTIQGKAS